MHTYKQSSRCLLLSNGSDLRILNLTLGAYYCLACSPGSQLLSFCLSTLHCILMWGNSSLAIASSQAVQNRGHLLHSQKSQVRIHNEKQPLDKSYSSFCQHWSTLQALTQGNFCNAHFKPRIDYASVTGMDVALFSKTLNSLHKSCKANHSRYSNYRN